MFEVEFYETEKGVQPAKEFLLSLDVKMRAKGFIKKTNKTPANEIEKAKKYRTDYLKRKEGLK